MRKHDTSDKSTAYRTIKWRGEGMVKLIVSPFDLNASQEELTSQKFNKHWNFYFAQLTHTHLEVKRRGFDEPENGFCKSPQTNQNIDPSEFKVLSDEHTEMTSLSWLPKDGMVALLQTEHEAGVGFITDIRKLYLLPHLVFPKDGYTNFDWWFDKDSFDKFASDHKGVTFNDLIEAQQLYLEESDKIREYNELMFGVSPASLIAIAMQPALNENRRDYYKDRFNAIYRKIYVYTQLKRNLPIFIVDPKSKPAISQYTIDEQLNDLTEFLQKNPKNVMAQYLLTQFELMQKVCPEEFDSDTESSQSPDDKDSDSGAADLPEAEKFVQEKTERRQQLCDLFATKREIEVQLQVLKLQKNLTLKSIIAKDPIYLSSVEEKEKSLLVALEDIQKAINRLIPLNDLSEAEKEILEVDRVRTAQIYQINAEILQILAKALNEECSNDELKLLVMTCFNPRYQSIRNLVSEQFVRRVQMEVFTIGSRLSPTLFRTAFEVTTHRELAFITYSTDKISSPKDNTLQLCVARVNHKITICYQFLNAKEKISGEIQLGQLPPHQEKDLLNACKRGNSNLLEENTKNAICQLLNLPYKSNVTRRLNIPESLTRILDVIAEEQSNEDPNWFKCLQQIFNEAIHGFSICQFNSDSNTSEYKFYERLLSSLERRRPLSTFQESLKV